ncbi:MAG: hypothetical protein ACI8S6_001086 [Myxococcota bacterium]|jgi:uncharacterized protein YndB with AHSA1/START domain
MISFSSSLTIKKPLAEVFAFWSDPDNIPRWQGGVVSYRRDSAPAQPLGVGTRYTVVRKALGMQQETHGEYTAFEPLARIVEKVAAGPASYTVETRFTDLNNQTRVDVSTDLELGGMMGRLGEKLAARPVKKQATEDHARICKMLEAR